MTLPAVPSWLAAMRAITGMVEVPGSGDNQDILQMARTIGREFPEMKGYCDQYKHDSIPWCGLTVAFCMAVNGIRPVFGRTDTDKFLWADAWRKFGTPLKKPKLGCVMVFKRTGGGHVSLYEAENSTTYSIRGGNQSDSINVTRMLKSNFVAALWPDQ